MKRKPAAHWTCCSAAGNCQPSSSSAWATGPWLKVRSRPRKIHTGYIASNGPLVARDMRPGELCDLIAAFPDTDFVLLHGGYPYGGEALSLTKHFRNVYTDLCWGWQIDPLTTADLLRKFLRVAPINKLFVFGGDMFWPTGAWAAAVQTRRWLARALSAEVSEGYLSLADAKDVASRIMCRNQCEFFGLRL